MGFLDRFKAPKATISVTLDKQAFNLNEPMTGTLSVSSSEEIDADKLRIELYVEIKLPLTYKNVVRT